MDCFYEVIHEGKQFYVRYLLNNLELECIATSGFNKIEGNSTQNSANQDRYIIAAYSKSENLCAL